MKPWHLAILAVAALVTVPLVEAALLMPVIGRTSAQACMGSTRFVPVPRACQACPDSRWSSAVTDDQRKRRQQEATVDWLYAEIAKAEAFRRKNVGRRAVPEPEVKYSAWARLRAIVAC